MTNKFKIDVLVVTGGRGAAVDVKNSLIGNPRRRRRCLNDRDGASGRSPRTFAQHAVVSISNKGSVYYGVTRDVNTYINTMFGESKGTRRVAQSSIGNAIATFGAENITTAKNRANRQIGILTAAR